MKKIILLGLIIFSATPGYTQSSPRSEKVQTGILFDLTSLLGGIEAYGDGFQSGAGLKVHFTDAFAARALLNFYYNSNSELETSESAFGLSLGGLYHFITGKVSPYAGAFAGVNTSSTTAGNVTTSDPAIFYLGLAGGAEVQLMENLHLFCEYNALFVFGETFTARFGHDGGVGKNALLGLIVYF